jgi:hypothetical protein
MTTEKLFRVLVLGGALIVANSATAQAQTTTPAEELPAQTFCEPKNPDHCVTNTCNPNEPKVEPKKGIVCCWGTSCEQDS